MKTLTVFTPAYNRAHTIGRTYESLCRQTLQDFEWLVVDDGSTDNTRELVEGWIREGKIPIRYIYQENQGMHGAHNTAYANINTELNTCIDSDDYMPDDAVETIVNFWRKNGSDKYAGLVGLDCYADGKIIGQNFPEGMTESTMENLHESHIYGDKKQVYRTDVMQAVPPYPLFEGEHYVGLCYKWQLVDLKYPMLTLNKPLCIVEYQTDGSSANMFRQYWNNPKGWSFLRKHQMKMALSYKSKFRHCIHYVSHSIRLRNWKFIGESPMPLSTILAIPAGVLLYFYTRHKVKRGALLKNSIRLVERERERRRQIKALLSNPVYCIFTASRLGLPLWWLLRLLDVGARSKETHSLEEFHQDPDNSCICSNEIEKEYDLQVVVPVYNVEEYVAECLDSIVGQETRYSFCITIVNDGSTDNSPELVRKYGELPNVEIIDKKNGGLAAARNAALKHMRGRYVTFVDSDDSLCPGAIEALMSAAERWDCDVVQGSYRMFRGEKTLSYTKYEDGKPTEPLCDFFWGKVYRAELFENIGLPEGYWVEDWVNGCIILEKARSVRTISDVVVNYRRNSWGITMLSKGNYKCIDSVYVTRRLLKDRRLLGMAETQESYEVFLRHLRETFKSTLSIPSKHVWRAVFEEEARLREEFFSGFSSNEEDFRGVEQAMEAGNYKEYFFAMVDCCRRKTKLLV